MQLLRTFRKLYVNKMLTPHIVRVFKRNHVTDLTDKGEVEITWRKKDWVKTTMSPIGWNIMRAAQKEGIELEGACEGVCACSTCHVILEDQVFDSIEEPSEEEDDMLDQAFGLTDTSRLGCQIPITADMDGMTIVLPAATRNFYVDGHVPQPH
jgi:ferredoxin-2, mitochondrial